MGIKEIITDLKGENKNQDSKEYMTAYNILKMVRAVERWFANADQMCIILFFLRSGLTTRSRTSRY